MTDWTEQLNRDPAPVVKPMPKARIGLKKGDLVLLPSARLVDDFIRAIPKGKSISLLEMRSRLARRHKAEGTCPVYLGYRLRTVAEAAFEALARGVPLRGITPIWRVLDENSLTLKKLAADRVALVLAQRRRERLPLSASSARKPRPAASPRQGPGRSRRAAP